MALLGSRGSPPTFVEVKCAAPVIARKRGGMWRLERPTSVGWSAHETDESSVGIVLFPDHPGPNAEIRERLHPRDPINAHFFFENRAIPNPILPWALVLSS